MADLLPKERLQPSLLDRLTDDDPGTAQESREKRVLSLSRLRQSVLRDLGWLLNAAALEAVQDLESYPQAARSVINYGMPGLAGIAASGIDTVALERRLKQTITDFEPRILPNSLKVRVLASTDQMNLSALTFMIEGDLWAQPLPAHMLIRSVLDLETGHVEIVEGQA
jgi:type VI secretion system protein ImpF